MRSTSPSQNDTLASLLNTDFPCLDRAITVSSYRRLRFNWRRLRPTSLELGITTASTTSISSELRSRSPGSASVTIARFNSRVRVPS